MVTYIGADFFIGNVMIALHQKSVSIISIADLRSIGRKYQDFCNENEVDALVLLSGNQIENAVGSYSEFFDLIPLALIHI